MKLKNTAILHYYHRPAQVKPLPRPCAESMEAFGGVRVQSWGLFTHAKPTGTGLGGLDPT